MREVSVFRGVPGAIQALDKLRAEISNAPTFERLAEAARTAAAIQAKFKPIKQVADKAGVVRVEADLKLAAELAKLPKAKGTRGTLRGIKPGKSKGRGGTSAGGSKREPPAETPTLAHLGVDKKWAARGRALARISEADQARIVEWLQEQGADVTPANIIKQAKQEAREEKRANYAHRVGGGGSVKDLIELRDAGKKFAVISADPPWEFKVYSGKGKERSAERHYDTTSVDKIAKMSFDDEDAGIPFAVMDLALEDCALFLWCVWPELPGALKVITAWGFAYKTVAFVWVKTTKEATEVGVDGKGLHWGMGYWTRANTEVCLLATRGSPPRLNMDVHQVVVAPVGEHSVKPEEIYRRIERLVPGPYLELFARSSRTGWTTWGNEIAANPLEAAA